MERAEKMSKHVALFLSVVYPGIGQFVQRRWLAGTVYFTLFSITLVWFIYAIVGPLFQILKVTIDWASQIDTPYPTMNFSISSILKPVLVSILIFIINIVDVSYGNSRRPLPAAKTGPPTLPKI